MSNLDDTVEVVFNRRILCEQEVACQKRKSCRFRIGKPLDELVEQIGICMTAHCIPESLRRLLRRILCQSLTGNADAAKENDKWKYDCVFHKSVPVVTSEKLPSVPRLLTNRILNLRTLSDKQAFLWYFFLHKSEFSASFIIKIQTVSLQSPYFLGLWKWRATSMITGHQEKLVKYVNLHFPKKQGGRNAWNTGVLIICALCFWLHFPKISPQIGIYKESPFVV